MEPKRYHHGDLKRTLLKVADRELNESGPQNLSLREIAKKAGVSHTAPYKHFRDKEELLKEMVLTEYKNLVQFTEEIEWRYPDAESQFQAFAERILTLAGSTPRKFNLMFATQLDFADEITKSHKTMKENLVRLSGSESARHKEAVNLFWYSLIGAALLYSQKRTEGANLEKIVPQLVSKLSF